MQWSTEGKSVKQSRLALDTISIQVHPKLPASLVVRVGVIGQTVRMLAVSGRKCRTHVKRNNVMVSKKYPNTWKI